MSTSTPPYYPSMYYMVRSSPWINGVYGGPSLSGDQRTATFSVTVTAPSRAGTYSMYAYGRDNPFGRTCTGDSYNFANSSNFNFVVAGDAAAETTTTARATTTTTVRATTTTGPAATTTTAAPTTTVSDNVNVCIWQTSTRPGVPGRYLLRNVPRADLAEYRGVFNLIPAPEDGCPSGLRLASATTVPEVRTTAAPTVTAAPEVDTTLAPTTTTRAPAATTSTTTPAPAATTSTTTPIYEPPVVDTGTPTTVATPSSSTIPARPETVPDPAFVAADDEVEAAIQVVDSNEVAASLSVQGRLVLNVGNFVKVRGRGFERAGFAEVWLFSTPRLLGRVPKDDSGNFVGRVRIPDDIEQGEHTIELRAVTGRKRVVTVAVPAIVLGTNDNSTDDTVVTTTSLPTTTTAAAVSESGATEVTAPPAQDVAPIKVQPGATEVALPKESVLAVIGEILGAGVDPSTAAVRVRVAPQDWQPFDAAEPADLVLPLAADSTALEIEVTPEGGEPIVRSIAITTGSDGSRSWWWLIVLVILVVVSWQSAAMRRRRNSSRAETA